MLCCRHLSKALSFIEGKVLQPSPPHPLLTWEGGVVGWCTECGPTNCTVVRAVIWAEISTPDNFQLCSDQRGGMARCNPLPPESHWAWQGSNTVEGPCLTTGEGGGMHLGSRGRGRWCYPLGHCLTWWRPSPAPDAALLDPATHLHVHQCTSLW